MLSRYIDKYERDLNRLRYRYCKVSQSQRWFRLHLRKRTIQIGLPRLFHQYLDLIESMLSRYIDKYELDLIMVRYLHEKLPQSQRWFRLTSMKRTIQICHSRRLHQYLVLIE